MLPTMNFLKDNHLIFAYPLGMVTNPDTNELILQDGHVYLNIVNTVWFDSSNLTNVDFSNSDLEYVVFANANLANADFSGVVIEPTQLSCTQLDQIKQDTRISTGESIEELKEMLMCK